VSRYIRAIYAPRVGQCWSNQQLFEAIAARFAKLEAPDSEKGALLDFVRLLLIGSRNRYCLRDDILSVDTFPQRAAAFESSIETATSALVSEIQASNPEQHFDAVFGVSSEGQLLPGIAERAARKLGSLVSRSAVHLDIGNGGCTASTRAIQLVSQLDSAIRNALIVVVEPTSTMADPESLARSNWQGVCTFGDGCAAVWISDEPGEGAVELGRMASWRGEATDIIRWDWGEVYYRFGIADLEQFEVKVRREVLEAMIGLNIEKDPDAGWAIHPAGIMLLLSLAKKLGLSRSKLEPSIEHFRECSNMSSVSVLHILKRVINDAEPNQRVRWLAMGAGFHVATGSAVRV
jgi:predicted naringenin-chalcone synthase